MRSLAIAAAAAATLALATAATAGTSSATTTFVNPPAAGTTLYVTFTLFTTAPVVPYGYAVQNTCVYPSKLSGHYTLGQYDAIAAWTDTDPVTGAPQVTMPVYLQSVPSGSACKVALMDNNNRTVVKGSSVSYTVP